MKNTAVILMALGLALPAMTLAQDSDQPRPQRRERPALREGGPGEPADRPTGNREGDPGGVGQRPMMVPPLMAALDTNHDGVIDEDEIKNAAESLRKLDKNGDGKITADEIRPQRRGGPEAGVRGEDRRPEGDPEGVSQRGDRNGPPGDGARPPRRNQRPPEGQ
jgi:hypothetical protein